MCNLGERQFIFLRMSDTFFTIKLSAFTLQPAASCIPVTTAYFCLPFSISQLQILEHCTISSLKYLECNASVRNASADWTQLLYFHILPGLNTTICYTQGAYLTSKPVVIPKFMSTNLAAGLLLALCHKSAFTCRSVKQDTISTCAFVTRSSCMSLIYSPSSACSYSAQHCWIFWPLNVPAVWKDILYCIT